MTPQELKSSILQLAIQGKLVEQRPEEGTAEELLVKNRKKPAPIDNSYDIPERWCWALLPDVADILYGFPFNSEKFNEAQIGMPIIRIRDIISGQSKTFSDEECDERYRIKRGDMLVGMDGNFQVAFWNSEDAWLNQRVCKITADSFLLNQNYLFFYLPIILEEINGSVSYSTVKHLSAKLLNSMRIPLPPLAEQKRIVAKIEELLPLIERYEKAWSRLEDFNKRFPGDMQKSILQMAIQGKLVEQRPEEGNGEELYRQIQAEKQALIKTGKIKKEKPLPEITEDQIPFEIPESWKWVRLATVTDTLSGFAFKSEDFKTEGKYRLLRGINLGVNDIRWKEIVYVDTVSDRVHDYRLASGDVLLGLDRPWISDGTRVAIFDEEEKETFLVQRVLRIKGLGGLTSPFIALLLQSSLLKDPLGGETTGISVPHISPNQVGNIAIPLPPLAEQKRIVARLEELLPLCEKLK
ncbi:MAG: restriction endonuclease subunit S [Oscillospiraceae bacterium]|nr:restriction endonuclease subunit S [Oscillospiraceae bacterium]